MCLCKYLLVRSFWVLARFAAVLGDEAFGEVRRRSEAHHVGNLGDGELVLRQQHDGLLHAALADVFDRRDARIFLDQAAELLVPDSGFLAKRLHVQFGVVDMLLDRAGHQVEQAFAARFGDDRRNGRDLLDAQQLPDRVFSLQPLLHQSAQQGCFEGLRNEGVDAEPGRLRLRFVVLPGRHHDDRDGCKGRHRLDAPAHLQSRHDGHHLVGEDQLRAEGR